MRLAWLLLVPVACGEPAPPPDERLPAHCQDVCYLGGCCERVNGAWALRSIDCARPVDAGVEPLPDGAPDA